MRSRAAWFAIVAILVLGASPGSPRSARAVWPAPSTDAQGAVLPGVTVTATSPALIGDTHSR